MRSILLVACLLPITAGAAEIFAGKMSGPSEYTVVKQATVRGQFTKIQAEGFAMSKTVGEPELPVQSYLLAGMPKDIDLQIKAGKTSSLENVLVAPVQKDNCRCETGERPGFQLNQDAYSKQTSQYALTYLGMFRGHPVSKLDLYFARFDGSRRTLVVQHELEVSSNVEVFEMPREEYKDYLILGPAALVSKVEEFANWKRSQGYAVSVEALQAPQLSKEAVQALVKDYYQNKGVDFVIIVGDERTVPQFSLPTSGSSVTPSDLPYFTMDGAGDNIPDMFTSRIVSTSAADAAVRLSKATEFEQKSFKNKDGLKRIVGIASNEGSGPSDDEYVKAIAQKYESVLNYTSTHFAQNDPKSNPTELNKALDIGAVWLTYLGHGSGYGWPSMYQSYGITDIQALRNSPAVKPVLIDVACMNGKLMPGYFGTAWDAITGEAAGTSAYYGGSVNISWHPPAVMARGIAFEHVDKNFAHLGEALLAGQLYLAKNWSSAVDVIDNMEWYHLQGDPGMNIRY